MLVVVERADIEGGINNCLPSTTTNDHAGIRIEDKVVMCVRCVSGDGKRPSVVEVSDTCNTPRVSHHPIFEWTPDSSLVLAMYFDRLRYIDMYSYLTYLSTYSSM